LPRIAKGETPATDLLEWPRDVLEFMWRRVCPLHDHQLPPKRACDDWTTWLVLGGRGAGKTRAGAEWVMGLASGFGWLTQEPVGRIALVGETFAAARDVMIEGPAGLLKIHEPGERPAWSPTLRKLEWPNGAVAHVFSAEDPDSLRGPQFEAAWCDELAKWRHVEETWDMLQFGLRLGARPREVVTTTPRPIPLLRRLLSDERVAVSRAATEANAQNLSPAFLDRVVGRYAGTLKGRQELGGEMVEDRPDALWTRDAIERLRVERAPPLARIVVAVDPPARRDARPMPAASWRRASTRRASATSSRTQPCRACRRRAGPSARCRSTAAFRPTRSSSRRTRAARWSRRWCARSIPACR